MRILMLSQFYPPFIGGEERLIQDLSIMLAERGHDISVVTLWQEGLKPIEIDRGVKIYRLRSTAQRAQFLYADRKRSHIPPAPDPEVVLGLRRILASARPQIVHAHNWLVYSFLPLKPWSNAKLVYSLHDYSLICPTKKLLYHDSYGEICSGPALLKCIECATTHYHGAKAVPIVLAKNSMRILERTGVNMYLPVSQFTALSNNLAARGLPFQVIPNFIRAGDGESALDVEPFLAQLPSEYLLFVGAFGAYKGVDVLLQAYARLSDAPPLVMIGYETAEHQVATAHLPQNVVLLKNWPHAAVMEAWRRSTLGVIPSLFAETFGLVALEAMQMGRPVIASRIGGLPEVVGEGETGILVPPGDASALQEAMARLLADTELRARMGRAAQERAQTFSADAIIPRFEHVYRSLLGTEDIQRSADCSVHP